MQLFFILLLIALIAAGYYVYRRLLEIEREIRAEQRALVDEDDSSSVEAEPAPAPAVQEASAGNETPNSGRELSEAILQRVEENPGLTQTELYANFPGKDRRDLQKILRELDQQGQLRREKKGTSYRLHPL